MGRISIFCGRAGGRAGSLGAIARRAGLQGHAALPFLPLPLPRRTLPPSLPPFAPAVRPSALPLSLAPSLPLSHPSRSRGCKERHSGGPRRARTYRSTKLAYSCGYTNVRTASAPCWYAFAALYWAPIAGGSVSTTRCAFRSYWRWRRSASGASAKPAALCPISFKFSALRACAMSSLFPAGESTSPVHTTTALSAGDAPLHSAIAWWPSSRRTAPTL